jgi:hypothetical protein
VGALTKISADPVINKARFMADIHCIHGIAVTNCPQFQCKKEDVRDCIATDGRTVQKIAEHYVSQGAFTAIEVQDLIGPGEVATQPKRYPPSQIALLSGIVVVAIAPLVLGSSLILKYLKKKGGKSAK